MDMSKCCHGTQASAGNRLFLKYTYMRLSNERTGFDTQNYCMKNVHGVYNRMLSAYKSSAGKKQKSKSVHGPQ